MNALNSKAAVWRYGFGLLAGAIAMLCRLLTPSRGGPDAKLIVPVPPEGGGPVATSRRLLRQGAWIAMLSMLLLPQTALAVPVGTDIVNVAHATYVRGGADTVRDSSNEIHVITEAVPTPSTLEVLSYAPGDSAVQWVRIPPTYYSSSGSQSGPFLTSPEPTVLGTASPLTAGSILPIVPTSLFQVNEPLFVRLSDPDQNLDSAAVDTVLVTVYSPPTGDREFLEFEETGPASGIFAGYIQSYESASSGAPDGMLAVTENSVIQLQYADPDDPADSSRAEAGFLASSDVLFVSIQADREAASVDEFVRYTVRVENTSDFDLSNVTVVNELPRGVHYQSGSLTNMAALAGAPFMAANAATMTYDIAMLQAHGALECSYVVQIARTNAAKVTSVAYAQAGAALSNRASTTVWLKEDLFRSRAIIVGQVQLGDCDSVADMDSVAGLEGARVYLDDGTVALTDHHGFYHFEGVRPGTHVVQLDLADLSERYKIADCVRDNRHAGRAYSQFVDVQGGTMWRADFHVVEKPAPAPPQGELSLSLEGYPKDSLVQYAAIISNEGVLVTGAQLSVKLANKLQYVLRSSFLSDSIPIEPRILEGILTFDLDSIAAGERVKVWFDAVSTERTEDADLATKAVLSFETPAQVKQTTEPVTHIVRQTIVRDHYPLPTLVLNPRFESLSAKLDDEARKEILEVAKSCAGLQIVQTTVTGHSDNIPISPRSRHIFADNYELSKARAESVGQLLMTTLHLDPDKLKVLGVGPDQPLVKDDSPVGRYRNRRVEVRLIAERREERVRLEVIQSGEVTQAATEGELPEAEPEIKIPEPATIPHVPEITAAGLDSLGPAAGILWPTAGFYPSLPSLKVLIKHDPGTSIELYLDGKPVDAWNFVDRTLSQAGQVALSRWAGIDIHEGTNRLLALVTDSASAQVDTLTQEVYYSGPPERAELLEDQSLLFADGNTPIVLSVRLTDRDGFPARSGVTGEVSLNPPFITERDHERLKSYSLTGRKIGRSQYEVGLDGVTQIRLMPTSQAGEVVLRFHFVDHEQEIRVWLDPREREWIMVGFAEGVMGYNVVSGNLEALQEDSTHDEYYLDTRTAFFAKGRIKGKWLMTLAYDSERGRRADETKLGQEIDPDAYYTVYGDATTQSYDAPSNGKLYVKMERKSFYALFGSYRTGLTVTELTRYDRSFNGAKAELHTNTGRLTAFMAESRQEFAKDELRGDGTSGPYRLSRSDVVMNSDKVSVEVRDRYRSELVLERRTLRRHLDYSIDYVDGTIFFKEPVMFRDDRLNPVYVVVDYETLDPRAKSYTYGGRGAVRSRNQMVELGGSYIHEESSEGPGDLGGLDATVDVSAETQFKAELAWSSRDRSDSTIRGRGYLAEIRHAGGGLTGRAYVREQEDGFGFGQQNASEAGTRKIGFDATKRFRDRFAIDGVGYRQYNLTSDAERDVAQLQLKYSVDQWHLRTGYRYAEDRLANPETNRSQQVTVGGDYRFARDRMRVRFDHAQSINDNANRDFPTTTQLGIEYQPIIPVTVFAEQEYASGDFGHSNNTRLGSKLQPWRGAQFHNSLEAQGNESGERLFSNLGLRQSVRLTSRLSADGTLDYSHTIYEAPSVPFDSAVPPAVGAQENFLAVSTGIAHRSDNWAWTTRLELRDGDWANKYAMTAGAYGEPSRGIGMSGALQVVKRTASAEDTRGNLRLGMVYRPPGDAWMALNRLDLIVDRHEETSTGYDNWRFVHNANVNFRPQALFQLAVQTGWKYVRDKIVDGHYSSVVALLGIELRRDFARNWDVGARGSFKHSFEAKVTDYSAGLSVGHSLIDNNWVSVGYNITGFTDGDFSAAGYTAAGPFIQFRYKFDQESVLGIARALGFAAPPTAAVP